MTSVSVFIVQVKLAVQQAGFLRHKRGYVKIRGMPVKGGDVTAHRNDAKLKGEPNDPLFDKQWYIVSMS